MDYTNEYNTQRHRCKNRTDANGNPIKMLLTYDEWLSLWQASGHLQDRGRGKGKYCMCRYNDTGHYELSNVFIGLFEDNVSDAQLGNARVPSPEWYAKTYSNDVKAQRTATLNETNKSNTTKQRRSDAAKARAQREGTGARAARARKGMNDPKVKEKLRKPRPSLQKYKYLTPMGQYDTVSAVNKAYGWSRGKAEKRFESKGFPEFRRIPRTL